MHRGPNHTCLPLAQPELDSMNTAATFDLLTFECRGAGCHCFPSHPLIWINPAVVKHGPTSVQCDAICQALLNEQPLILIFIVTHIVMIDFQKNVAN